MNEIENRLDRPDQAGQVVLAEYETIIRRLLASALSEGTRRVYRIKLGLFGKWCSARGLSPLPASPETILAYVAELAQQGVSVSALTQSLAAISAAHRAAQMPSPTQDFYVQQAVRGYRREHGIAAHRATAATGEIVKRMIRALLQEDSLRNLRDAALLSLGFAGAFRRSELVALNVEDLSWDERDGREVALVLVRRSKTDPEGHGMIKAVFGTADADTSPTLLLRRWMDAAGITEGAVFRRIRKGGHVLDTRLDGQTVGLVIQRAAAAAGLGMELTAHSLRSGFITSAIRRGMTERAIMNQTGHRSTAVMRGYYERESAIEDNAGCDVW